MSVVVCAKCQKIARLLEGPSKESWAEYYACDACGHVWAREKDNPKAPPKTVLLPASSFRVVQAWGPDKGRQNTLLSQHPTLTEAFAALDHLASEMARTGRPSDAIELVVVDDKDQVVPRPGNALIAVAAGNRSQERNE